MSKSPARKVQRKKAAKAAQKNGRTLPAGARWRLTELAVIPVFHLLNRQGKVVERLSTDPRQAPVLMEADVVEEIYEMLEKKGLTPGCERMR